VPTPSGAQFWTLVFVRLVILNDLYCSYSYEEVKPLVAPEVTARIDHEQRYGIF
jgi:hypothetical protein